MASVRGSSTATDGRVLAFTARGMPKPRLFPFGNPVGLIGLIRREAMREIRWFGLAVIGPAVQAVLFASVFVLAAGDRIAVDGISFIEFLAAGLVISATMQRALEATGYSIMFDKLESDGMQDVLGAPLSPLEIIVAYLVTAIVVSVTIGAGIALALIPFGLGLPVHPVWAFFYLCLAAGIFSMVGLIGAVFSPKWDSFAGKETFITLPVVFLSGTFFPITAVPEGIWRTVFQANPIYYLVDGFRWAMTGRAEVDPISGLLVGGGLFLVVYTIASVLLATGYKIKP